MTGVHVKILLLWVLTFVKGLKFMSHPLAAYPVSYDSYKVVPRMINSSYMPQICQLNLYAMTGI